MNALRITSRYLDLIFQGRKKTTVRLGKRFIPKNEAVLLEDELGRHVALKISKVTVKRQSELDQEDAVADGFGSREELLSSLKELYPNSSAADLFTIIEFEVNKLKGDSGRGQDRDQSEYRDR
ncbi:ASCH domain-containing protein [Dehalococcoidia bacterium]|nr:ASCH domain-containing protein [Dehalococcoidia bacterium]